MEGYFKKGQASGYTRWVWHDDKLPIYKGHLKNFKKVDPPIAHLENIKKRLTRKFSLMLSEDSDPDEK